MKGRFPPSLLKQQAEHLRMVAVVEAARNGINIHIPNITSRWMKLWKRRFRISLRVPNLCFKVPKAVFVERCRICWSNVYRARRFIQLMCGYDPVVEGFDQTPFHFCESGSKSKKTLDFTGKKSISLKECHAATRARWTANTWTTSDLELAMSGPPLELMFKGGTGVLEKCMTALDALRATGVYGELRNVSVTTSSSASYDKADVLDYLKRHLLPWGPKRKWRILLADAFRPHLCDEVRELCWKRGYLMTYIGGGCTPALQVNDTHLHGPLSRDYQTAEMHRTAHKMSVNPRGLNEMKREDCIAMIIGAYYANDRHAQAGEGYKQNLFTNALDGSEDTQLGSEQILRTFKECDMEHERARIMADLQNDYDSGRLSMTYTCFMNVMEPMPIRGHLDHVEDGMDDELEDYWLGDPWDDGAGVVSDYEGGDSDHEHGCDIDHEHEVDSVSEKQVDSASEKRAADEVAHWSDQISQMDKILEQVTHFNDAGVVFALERARKRIQQKATGAHQSDIRIARAVRNAVDKQASDRVAIQQENNQRHIERQALTDEKQRLAAEQAEVIRKTNALAAQQKKANQAADIANAALAFEAKDFVESPGVSKSRAWTNRWHALRRVLALCGRMPIANWTSLLNDFIVWDRGVHEAGIM